MSKLAEEVGKSERLILNWLRSIRTDSRRSQFHPAFGDAFYWNEREYQWSLFSFMRKKATSYGLGSEWRIHAEGPVERPSYIRKSKWPTWKRVDVVVFDHEGYLSSRRAQANGERPKDLQPFISAIEVKLVWSGEGLEFKRGHVQKDVDKLHALVNNGMARSGYLVLLDGVSPRTRQPIFSEDVIWDLIAGTKVGVFHWPDVGTTDLKIQDHHDARAAMVRLYRGSSSYDW